MPAIATILRYLKTITQPGHTEDSDLLEAFCARQDEEAFAQLVHRYGGLVFGVCRRVLSQETDAEDAFQATFVLLARRAASIDRERPLASWLYTVAYQTSLKARSRRERRRQVERQAPTRMIAPDTLPASEWQDLRRLLDEEVLALPSHERDLILLCDIEGKGHRRVAEELCIPAGSVSRKLEKARDRLRRRLTRRGVSLAGVALTSILAQEACAAVPPRLAADAIHSALAGAAGLPASVAELVASVPGPAGFGQMKAALLVLVVGTSLAAGGAAFSLRATPPASEDAVALAPAIAPEDETGRGKAVRGLRLLLSADRTETTLPAGAAQAEPVTLRLQFRNESNQPLKLKTDNLGAGWERRHEILVIGPDADSVRLEERDAPPAPMNGFFQVLAAGKSRLAAEGRIPGSFPGSDGKIRSFALCKPGKYTIRVRYVNNDKDDLPLAAGVWTGSVDSNDCVITVRAAESK